MKSINKYHLMCPGPTEIPPAVLSIAGLPMIHHRSQQFRDIFEEVSTNLKSVFMTKQPVLILSTSGTGGMEACIVNLSDPGETIIVISGGVFGERWAKIGESLNRRVIKIDVPWGEPVDPDVVAQKLTENPEAVLVAGTLIETSTGVEHPIERIAKLTLSSNALFVVDVVSGLGATVFKMDEWGVDAAVSGSQKGLMCAPGLALIALSKKAQETMQKKQGSKFYFSFELALKGASETPFTPNISVILQLSKALELILEEGLENVWLRHQILATATRAAIKQLGLELYSSTLCPSVTAVYSPNGIKSQEITSKMLKEWGIFIVAGQGKIKNEIFRIGHLGYCNVTDILMTIAALEMVLKSLRVNITLGNGVKAAQEIILKLSTA